MRTKRLILPAVLLLTLMSLGGCDFVRTIAGRPVSVQIDSIRRERAALLEQARIADSLKAALEDSLRIVREEEAAAALISSTVQPASLFKGIDTLALPERYYIVIGSFREPANAKALASRVAAAGFQSAVSGLRSGQAVFVCPSPTLVKAKLALGKLREHAFCPSDAWIIYNDSKE